MVFSWPQIGDEMGSFDPKKMVGDWYGSSLALPTMVYHIWLVVSTPLKDISQREGLSHILWKIKKCLKPPTRYYSYPVTIHCGFALIGTGTLVLVFCVVTDWWFTTFWTKLSTNQCKAAIQCHEFLWNSKENEHLRSSAMENPLQMEVFMILMRK